MKSARLKAIVLFTVMVLFAISLAFLSSATGSNPVLYKNDTKYTIAEYPAEVINGTLHVPLSFFIGLENIQYEYGTEPVGFYLRNKETGRFFSFSSDSKSIVVDSSLVDVSFPIRNSTVYLPMEYCAEILSLKTERKTVDGVERIRLTDGTQRLTFDELIELYDPTSQPGNPSVIEPERPSNPTDTPAPADRSLYITVDSCPNEHTDNILNALEKWDTKATFFFDSEGIKAYPETVIRAFVLGHGIGVSASSAEELKSANDALYSVLNCYTRICTVDGEISADVKEKIEEMGYVLWNRDIDTVDWSGKSAYSTARDLYNYTFKNQTTVVRLSSDEKSDDIVDRLLYYVSGDNYITGKVIDPTVKDASGGKNG